MSTSNPEPDVLDIEALAKAGSGIPPHRDGQRYRIRIDKTQYVVGEPMITGRQLLALAGKTPEKYRLDQKLRGGKTQKVEADQTVDLLMSGVEKFMTLPLDQTEGEAAESAAPRHTDLCRDFVLPEEDEEYLEAVGAQWETKVLAEGATRALWLFLHDYELPNGYVARGSASRFVTRAVRVTGYPGGALDMIYFSPPIGRADDAEIGGLSELQLEGTTFQQWSRHYAAANPFQVGEHNVSTHLAAAEEWLLRELRK